MEYTNLVLQVISKPLEWREKQVSCRTNARLYTCYSLQISKYKEMWDYFFGDIIQIENMWKFNKPFESRPFSDLDENETLFQLSNKVKENQEILTWMESVRFIS